jgi:cytochrome c-type biogenesis protein CcmH
MIARLLILLWLPLAVLAQGPQPMDNDPVANRRAVALAEKLRCLVCQNQSIADSNAELALDLKRQIREQIAAGRSDADITRFMVERYGDFVLYRPPLNAATLLLWLGPLLLLVGGFVLLLRHLRRRGASAAAPAPLSEAQRKDAAAMLSEDEAGR